ncbi:Alba domain-containing protein [Trichoderma simmonsii]|uniref:Alba domain-containing protein n=1 Tax=Trichoderma simmonsii TaxID=1491479 RepID=A0A8G0LQF3_9HYPO|nr:Alba domain-containing protein [Trichoderma simmonsii]
MSTDNASKKRKHSSSQPAPSKKPRTQANPTLIGPHEAILKELSAKHNVLALSVLSSTQIRKRVSSASSHLFDKSAESRAILLHARPADVCKMITVAEQCKRLLGEKDQAWYQYNELFDLPPEAKKKKKNARERKDVEEGAEEDSDSGEGAFEAMESRFEQAVLPPPRAQTYKSLRIFISHQAIPELNSRENVTVQTSEDTPL